MGSEEIKDSRYGDSSKPEYYDLTLYYCGFEQCPPLQATSRIRDFYVIHYVLSGRGIFRINGTTYKLSKGQGFVISPDVLTLYQADSNDPWSYCWFSFNGLKVKKYLDYLGLGNHNPVFNYDKDDLLEKYILQMIDAKSITSGRTFYLQSLMYAFFYKLTESLDMPAFTNKDENIGVIYVKKAVDFIEKNYSEKITVEELASYIGISRKHLFRVFKESLKISPQAFLINYRIDRACEFLANSALSIRDVAHSVGYEDPLLFSRVFKKAKNVPPSEYRKELVREENAHPPY